MIDFSRVHWEVLLGTPCQFLLRLGAPEPFISCDESVNLHGIVLHQLIDALTACAGVRSPCSEAQLVMDATCTLIREAIFREETSINL